MPYHRQPHSLMFCCQDEGSFLLVWRPLLALELSLRWRINTHSRQEYQHRFRKLPKVPIQRPSTSTFNSSFPVNVDSTYKSTTQYTCILTTLSSSCSTYSVSLPRLSRSLSCLKTFCSAIHQAPRIPIQLTKTRHLKA